MSKNIFFLRHGESQSNVNRVWLEDSPLTENGNKQAEYWGRYFSHKNIQQIYASPIDRARQTAQIINSQIHTKIILLNELKEINGGLLIGKSVDTKFNRNTHSIVLRNWENGNLSYSYPHGESFYDIKNRLDRFNRILNTISRKNIVVVSHTQVLAVYFWFYCKKHKSSIINNQLHRGAMAKIVETEGKFDINEFNVLPE